MKPNLVFSFIIAIILFSCKKESNTPPKPIDPALQYIGTFKVTEYANIVFGASFPSSMFIGKIEKGDSISRIKFDQSSRSPSPPWEGPYSTVIQYTIDSSKLIGYGTTNGEIFTKDSLFQSYIYRINGVTYGVKQTWVRQ